MTEPVANMESWQELRTRLVDRFALLIVVVGGTTAWLTLPREPFPAVVFWLLLLLCGFGLFLRSLLVRRQRLAQALLVWVPVLVLFVAIGFGGPIWLPFLVLVHILVVAVLMPGAEIAVAVATVLFSLWINLTTGARYPIVALALVLLVGTAVIWLTMRTLTTTLSWVEQAQRRTDRLLAETRSHRSQVSHALQSAEIANSRLRRVERELTIAQRDAEEARRMKEQFAANVSHELRTPLNLILGFSEMMYLSPEVYGAVNWTPALRRDTYQIYKNGRHLLDMIDDILALSQFEIASFALNKEATDVGPLLQSAVDIARDLFRTSTEILPSSPSELGGCARVLSKSWRRDPNCERQPPIYHPHHRRPVAQGCAGLLRQSDHPDPQPGSVGCKQHPI